MTPNQLTADAVIGKYVDIRDEITARKKEFEAWEKEQKARLAKMEAWLQAKLNQEGIDSFKGAHGTAFKTYKDSATIAAWDDFLYSFVIPEEKWEFLDHRVNKTAVKERLEAGETLPPGVNYSKIECVQVRRK